MAEKNILVVDDEDDARLMMARILANKNEDWKVDVASSESEAKDKIDRKHYHVIVTDMKMENNESGLAVLKYAKEKNESTDVIIITAYEDLKNASNAMRLSAFDYVSKADNDAYDLMCETVEESLSQRHHSDVFLCHNKKDKEKIKAIANLLEKNGISTWLDENINGGQKWSKVLVEKLKTIKISAVFLGENGIGEWQDKEIDILTNIPADQNHLIIPVVLPCCCSKEPDFPEFLKSHHYVDFRKVEIYPMAELIRSITEKPVKRIFIP